MAKQPKSEPVILRGVDRGASMRRPALAFKRNKGRHPLLVLAAFVAIASGVAAAWPKHPTISRVSRPVAVAPLRPQSNPDSSDLVPSRHALDSSSANRSARSGWGFRDLDLKPVHQVALSPDGGVLATRDSAGKLGLFHLATLQEAKLPTPLDGPVVKMVWSGDGAQLALATQNGRILSLDPASGQLRQHGRHVGEVTDLDWIGATPISCGSDGFLIFHGLDVVKVELGEPASALSAWRSGARVFGKEGAFLCTDAQGNVWRRSRIAQPAVASHSLAAGREMIGLGAGRWLELDVHTSEVVATCNLEHPDAAYTLTGIALRENSLIQRQPDGGHLTLVTDPMLQGATQLSADQYGRHIALLRPDGTVFMAQWAGPEQLAAVDRRVGR